MQYWMLKTEPEAFSWEQLVRDGATVWDGVRNYQARNNLKAMKTGDWALIYHSVSEKAVVGIAEVTREFYPDPTDNPPDKNGERPWVVVDIKPFQPLKRRITLAEIKADRALADIPLIKQSRLSVIPLEKHFFDHLVAMSEQEQVSPS